MDRKTTVCLITPPSCFLLDERVFVTLGILRVAACLERDGAAVEMLDLSGIQNYLEVVREHARRSFAAIFGLTATTPQMPAAALIVQALREVRPDARIILGGPHITLVHAAMKHERKLGTPGRGLDAFAKLSGLFDVLVAGDGEEAIFLAIQPDAPKLIDADDPKTALFLTSKRYGEMPLPARHLVDVSSYHYAVEGAAALSMIAQLGCLAPGTQILLPDGREESIEKIRAEDTIICWDEIAQELKASVVAATWKREAHDVWELTFSNCETMLVTSEHPILMDGGWKQVKDITNGDRVAFVPNVQERILRQAVPKADGEVLQSAMPQSSHSDGMPDLQEEVRVDSSIRAPGQLLLAEVPAQMDGNARQSEVAQGWAKGNEGEVGHNVSGGATKELQHQGTACCCGNGARSQNPLRDEAWQQEPNEAPGSRRESVAGNQGPLGRVLLGANEEALARWKNEDGIRARRNDSRTQHERGTAASNLEQRSADVCLCRQWCFLDRALSVRQKAQSGFSGQAIQESNPTARRVLALRTIRNHRDGGLRSEGLAGAGDLVERTTNAKADCSYRENSSVRFSTITSKRWVGRGKVHNLTVCPGHSYVANRIIVHNCPFACAFCGGRESAMLRRIRTRSTASIIAEMRHLYTTYDVRGIMFYDDELNVNKQVVELMHAIGDLGEELGVEWKLRGFVKSELFTDEQAEAMYRAGFRWLLVGFESGSPRVLENINKKATREQNTRCLQIAHQHGLKVKALMSLGHAGESAETVAQTKNWLLEQKPDDFDATVITTYPGTPYFDHAVEASPGIWTFTAPQSGDRLHAYETDFNVDASYYKGTPGEYKSFVFTDRLTAEEIVQLRDDLEKDVRHELGIPFNTGAPGMRYEASIGQLPGYLLRTT